MALTRAMLKAMSIEDEKIDQIIEAHSETVDSLKQQRDSFKAQAAKAEELEEAENAKPDDYKDKYEALNDEFEAFKAEVENARIAERKEALFRDLLKDAGVDPKRINAVVKATDLSEIEITKDGHIKDAEKVTESVKDEWSDFIAETQTKGAKVDTPPKNGGSGMSKDEIMAIKDPTERQRAIAENHELFGF